jgi:hypothetical protein
MVPENKIEPRRNMADYDTPGLTYDSGVVYADPFAPPIQIHMAKIKLNLNSLNGDQIVSLALQVKTAMTGNANFTTPNPTMPALGTGITNAQTKIAAYNSALAALDVLKTDRDTAVAALTALVRQEAAYVDNIANGSASIIQSAGMSVQSQRTPSGVPDMVQNLSLSAGDNAGEIDAHWDPVKGTKIGYDLQWTLTPLTEASWKDLPGTTKSKAALLGFPSGQQIYLRVRAKGSGGTGAWSQTASKFAP